jgi:glycosyltransferase involved in cell wall biosynthesis
MNKGKFDKIISEFNTLLLLRRLMREHKPTATLSFMDKYNVFVILASIGLGLRVFVSDRSNPLKTKSTFLKFLKRITYPLASGVIAQTKLAKEILAKEIRNSNIKVIPNPLKEIKVFPTIQREKIVLNVGRLVTEKGQKYLLEAFSNSKAHDWKLVILGDGPLRQELENQAIELGLQSRLEMPSAVKDVDQWYAKASLFVFPSISEGFPNALVEAMAAGLPVISFDCNAGPQDFIIPDKNGLLIPTGDTKILTESIDKLTSHPTMRDYLGENAKKINRALNLDKICNRYLDFLMTSQ